MVQGGSTKDPKESIQVLPTMRVPLEPPKEETGKTTSCGLSGGKDNFRV